MSNYVVCLRGHAADVVLGGGCVEGYVYEGRGRGEGGAVEGCNAGRQGLLLRGG